MKKLMYTLISALCLLFATSMTEQVYARTSPKLSKTSVKLAVGSKKKIKVKNFSGKVKWKSKNKKIATVSQKGVIRANKKGKTTIIAKIKDKKIACKVTVYKKRKQPDYKEVINQYKEASKNNYYRDILSEQSDEWASIGKNLNNELLMSSNYYKTFYVYYALYDLNNDGIKELLIDAGESEKDLGEYVYDVFTYKNRKVIRLFEDDFEFGYRMNLKINCENIFCIDSSGGADLNTKYYYKLSSNSVIPKLIQKVEYFEGLYYLYNSRGAKKSISESKANSIINMYENNIRKFNWKMIT